jgi:Ca2+-binding EF-hand superfamily protein
MSAAALAWAALLFVAPASMSWAQQQPDDEPTVVERYDANGDGAIDMAEFRAQRAGRFARLDPDDDGQVSKAAFLQAVAQSTAAEHAVRLERLFDKMDTNGDGILTRGEYLAYGEAIFARMDRNGDGKLTRKNGDELRAKSRP